MPIKLLICAGISLFLKLSFAERFTFESEAPPPPPPPWGVEATEPQAPTAPPAMLRPKYRVAPASRPKIGRKPASTAKAARKRRRIRPWQRKEATGFHTVLSGAGGLSLLTAQDTEVSKNRDALGWNKGLLLGGRLHIAYTDYIEVEADLLREFVATQETVDQIGSTTEVRSGARTSWGLAGMFGYTLKEVSLKPFLGVGYTSIRFSQSTKTPSLGESEVASTLAGIFARLGFSWIPLPRVELNSAFDFLLSGSNEMSLVQTGGAPMMTTYKGALMQLRLAGYYKLTDSFSLGVEFHNRQIRADGATPITPTGVSEVTSPTADESQTQILGSVRLRVF